jgi:hypothetical protein
MDPHSYTDVGGKAQWMMRTDLETNSGAKVSAGAIRLALGSKRF